MQDLALSRFKSKRLEHLVSPLYLTGRGSPRPRVVSLADSLPILVDCQGYVYVMFFPLSGSGRGPLDFITIQMVLIYNRLIATQQCSRFQLWTDYIQTLMATDHILMWKVWVSFPQYFTGMFVKRCLIDFMPTWKHTYIPPLQKDVDLLIFWGVEVGFLIFLATTS